MPTFFSRTKAFLVAHKLISTIVAIVIIGGGVWIYKAHAAGTATVQYVTAKAELGNVETVVTGSGQVSAENQIDLKPKASGEITGVYVKVGQQVSAGTLIASIDPGNAVYDLQNAELSYKDLTTVDPTELSKDQNSVTQASADVEKSYADALGVLTSASTNLNDVLTGMQDFFKGTGYLSANRTNVPDAARTERNNAEADYYAGRSSLDDFQRDYASISSQSSKADIDSFLKQAYDVSLQVAKAAKEAQDAVTSIKENQSTITPSDTAAYTSANDLSSKAASVVSSVTAERSSITNSCISLKEAEATLSDLQNGPKQTAVQSSALSVREKEDTLSDYSVRAPFAGVIASVEGKKGDSGSSGTAIATLITKEKVAIISLNEVDAAKVATGDKVTLTFDAIDGLTITGEVAEVNLVGTVSQGVVNYEVKIAFDTDDERIKPSMTANASIITASKQNVVTVATSAVKSQGDSFYVQELDASGAPVNQDVTVGLQGDELTEITSGLNEGDSYVAKTVSKTPTSATAATTRSSGSLLGGGGGGARVGGGAGFGR